jgi:hypothetical protein
MNDSSEEIKIGDYILNADGGNSGWRIVAITPEGYAVASEDFRFSSKVISREEIKNYKVARTIIGNNT